MSRIKNKIRKEHFLFILYPVATFIVLTFSEKKGGRYSLSLFPYLILIATLGYYLLNFNKLLTYFITAFVAIRLILLQSLFPDYLMYRNPLSPDFGFSNRQEAWGSGGKKVADYLKTQYGDKRTIIMSDYRTLYLYYPGKVLNKDEVTCKDKFDFLIAFSPYQNHCGRVLKSIDRITAHKDLTFYLLE